MLVAAPAVLLHHGCVLRARQAAVGFERASPMADHCTASRAGSLFELLTTHFPSWGRNTLRERLHAGCIEVDGVVALRQDQAVAAGARIEIRARGQSATPLRHRGPSGPALPVLHQDDDLLAVDKPPGLLSVSTDDEHERTALARARGMLPQGHSDLWPVHRLDRETSGVLLFARTRDTRDRVQAMWPTVRKRYVAIVAGCPREDEGTVIAPLWEDDNLRVRVGDNPGSKPARTHWRVVQRRPDRSLLEVDLDTGRKHQIRAHLAHLGHPVLGDDRYGDPGPRLCLHALQLSLMHPRTGAPLVLVAPLPRALAQVLEAK
jgi:23S rRNA pseudouridine1911/1915/1917 synthase